VDVQKIPRCLWVAEEFLEDCVMGRGGVCHARRITKLRCPGK
jgi:hypothetical protein